MADPHDDRDDTPTQMYGVPAEKTVAARHPQARQSAPRPRPSVPKPVSYPGPPGGSDLGPEPDSGARPATARSLRLLKEEAAKLAKAAAQTHHFELEQQANQADRSVKYLERKMKRSGWLRTVAQLVGVTIGTAVLTYMTGKAQEQTKQEVQAAVTPLKAQLEQVLDGGAR